MKIIIIVILLFLQLVFLFPCKIHASSSFVRYSLFPVISNSPNVWDSDIAFYPYVIKDNGLYKMWYSAYGIGKWSIAYATSFDGINWIKYPQNPVLINNDNNSSIGYKQPTVIKDGDMYKMWFTSINTPEGHDQIGYATSSSGIDWDIFNYKVFSPQQGWDSNGVTNPTVVKTNNEYKMWYIANSAGITPWNVGFATSSSGTSWEPYNGNPVLSDTTDAEWKQIEGITVKEYNSVYTALYHTHEFSTDWAANLCIATSSSGISWDKSTYNNPIITRNPDSYFDNVTLSGGSFIKNENNILIWYGGATIQNGSRKWQIGLAYEGVRPTEVPNPPPTTPTPTPLEPIVIIPGIMASWNKEALLYGQQNPTSAWKMLPYIREYEGIVKTLINIGYIEGETLFLWPYDWRKPISTITTQLNSFLANTIQPTSTKKIHLIGHSLGGLTARAWAQNGTNKDLVHKVITLGAPHFGTIQPYSLWEAGIIPVDNTLMSLAGNMFIGLNRKIFSHPKNTIQSLFPVLKDLLPTEPYLVKRTTNTLIPKNEMAVWNDWLTDLNTVVDPLFPNLVAVYGMGLSSPYSYTIQPPSVLEKALSLWTDGKPIATAKADGDGTIPITRASFLTDASIPLSKNHSELISSSQGIDAIVHELGIDHDESQIIEGKATITRPSILLFMRSPATFTVSRDSETIVDTDGVIFLPNASDGQYQIHITGTANGMYTFSIAQFTKDRNIWTDYSDTIKLGQTKSFQLNFSNETPFSDPLSGRTRESRFEELELLYTQLAPLVKDKKLMKQALETLKKAKNHALMNNYILLFSDLEQMFADLSRIRKSSKTVPVLQSTLMISDAIIRLAQEILIKSSTPPLTSPMISPMANMIKEKLPAIQHVLDQHRRNKTLSDYELLLLYYAQDYFQQAQGRNLNEFVSKYFLFKTSFDLFREVR